jgi:asparagine synthase (glutamine-hydrolysing)
MHGLIAYSGPDSVGARRIIETIAAGGLELASSSDGRTLVAVHGAGSVTRLVTEQGTATAFYGSAAQGCMSSSASLLDADPDDVVAAGFDSDGRLVVAAGRGSHRIFVVHDTSGGVWVSSSLHSLRRANPSLRLDRSYEDFLLGFGFVPDPHSMYDGVRVLKAGTRVSPASANGGIENVTPISYAPNTSTKRDEIIDALHDTLVETIAEQAGTHRRHAVLLGGFDSALVAAVLVGLGHEVETYTFRFADKTYVQRNIDQFTAHLGVRHHWVDFDSSVIAENLRGFADTFTQPCSQPHYQIHTLHAARRIAADGHDHIFTGDGCDAIFLGYPTVSRRASISAATKRIPPALTRLAIGGLSNSIVERRLGHVARMVRGTLNNRLLDEIVGAHLPTQVFDAAALARLRESAPPHQAEEVLAIRTRLAAGLDNLNRTQLAFNGNGLNGQSKVKVDGAVASTGIAQASPFMHSRLRTFVSGIPFEYLRSQGSSAASAGKEILVDMVRRRGLLPDVVIDQPKQSPSDSPVDDWYMNELRDEIMSQLGDLPFSWNRRYVEGLLAPKLAESWYRNKVSISHHTMQVIGLLASYASFNRASER